MSDMDAAREGGQFIEKINAIRKNEEMSDENKSFQIGELKAEWNYQTSKV